MLFNGHITHLLWSRPMCIMMNYQWPPSWVGFSSNYRNEVPFSLQESVETPPTRTREVKKPGKVEKPKLKEVASKTKYETDVFYIPPYLPILSCDCRWTTGKKVALGVGIALVSLAVIAGIVLAVVLTRSSKSSSFRNLTSEKWKQKLFSLEEKSSRHERHISWFETLSSVFSILECSMTNSSWLLVRASMLSSDDFDQALLVHTSGGIADSSFDRRHLTTVIHCSC